MIQFYLIVAFERMICIKILCEHRPYRKHKKMFNLFRMCCAKTIYVNKTVINLKSIFSYAIIKTFCFLYFLCLNKCTDKNLLQTQCMFNDCIFKWDHVMLGALNVCFLWKGFGEKLNSNNVIPAYFFIYLFSVLIAAASLHMLPISLEVFSIHFFLTF